jgi:uncharacterized membrane protein
MIVHERTTKMNAPLLGVGSWCTILYVIALLTSAEAFTTTPVLHSRQSEPFERQADRRPATPYNPTPVLFSTIQKLAGDSKTKGGAGLVAAAAALTFALMLDPANAAMSGGRMGGSFSSAPRQSISRPMPSRQSTRSYSSGGYQSGYARPGLTIAPTIGLGGYGYNPFYNPFYAPQPLLYGGPSVVAVSRGFSLLDALLVGGAGYIIWNAISARSDAGAMTDTGFWSDSDASVLGSGTSVIQMSVALQVPDRDDRNSILSVLERLSQTARTDSRVGIQNLASQVALELLRRKSTIISASTSYQHFRDATKAQRTFENLSVKERGKFERETVSRYGGVDYAGGTSRRSSGLLDSKATVAVVTLNLAIDGDSTKIPQINSIQDVEAALSKIAADVKVDDCLQSAEILWTPEDRSETLSIRDSIADYPELRSV